MGVKGLGKCFIVLASSKRMGQFEVYMHFSFWTTKELNIRLVELHKLQLQALQQSDTHIHELNIGFGARRLVQDLYGNGNLHSLALRYPDALKSQKIYIFLRTNWVEMYFLFFTEENVNVNAKLMQNSLKLGCC